MLKHYILTITMFSLIALNVCSANTSLKIRVIHFVPANTVIATGFDTNIDSLVKEAQTFYKNEMTRHGYDGKTFNFEANADDDVIINRINGIHTASYYVDWERIQPEVESFINVNPNNIFLVLLAGSRTFHGQYCGFGWDSINGNNLHSGVALLPTDGNCLDHHAYISHELGHAFGLRHNLSDPTLLMGAGNNTLAYYEAAWLDAHHYFNTAPRNFNSAPKITQIHPIETLENDTYKFKIDIEDTNDLHYAHIFVPTNIELVGWQAVHGKRSTVELTLPKSKIDTENNLIIQIMDVDGNYLFYDIPIVINVDTDPDVVYLTLVNGEQPVPNTIGLNPNNSETQWTFWGTIVDNKTNNNNQILIDGNLYHRGISVTPGNGKEAVITYDLSGKEYTRFRGFIGLADEHDHAIDSSLDIACAVGGSVVFTFELDDDIAYKSDRVTGLDAPIEVGFAIPSTAQTLTIKVGDADDGNWCDAAVIGDARLIIESEQVISTDDTDDTDDTEPITPIDQTTHKTDINADGKTDVLDLIIVVVNFGAAVFNPRADVNADGSVGGEDVRLVLDALEAKVAAAPQPAQITTALLPNYPNPFNPETWIPYQLAEPADVSLHIYAVDGQVVRKLDLGHSEAGRYIDRSRAAYWNGKNTLGEPVASGLYFYTLTAGKYVATRRLLILK